MVAAGFAWFVGTYAATADPVLDELAYAFQGYYDALLAWLVLAYPTGQLRGRPPRAVIAAFLGLLALRTLFRFAVFEHVTAYDFGNPADIERYIATETLRSTGELAFGVGIAALAAIVLVLVIARLRRESRFGRRVAAPILVGGLVLGTGIVLEVASRFVQPSSVEERAFQYDLGTYLTSLGGAAVAIGFVVGLTRSRLARGSVADLVVELGASPGPMRLRDALADALHDPSLEVAYALPGDDGYVDGGGKTIALPEGRADRAVTHLEHDGRVVAALIHDPALSEDVELVRSVAAAARLALENERLQAEVRAQLDEVRASRARIVAAGDAERRRIERDLHDGAQQRLVTLALALQMAHARASEVDPELEHLLARATDELGEALGEVRELARGLHPSLLTEAGLRVALEVLAERFPLPVHVSIDSVRQSPEVEATAYFVVAESLTNVAKHAHATRVDVDVSRAAGLLVVQVRDDGGGGADASLGSGLRGLSDRVAAIGGGLWVESPTGGGTTIIARIPCA